MKPRKSLYDFQKELQDQGVFFCFSGALSQNLLKDIIRHLHLRHELADAGKPTFNRIISIIIELLQNVIYYSAIPPKDCAMKDAKSVGEGMLVIGCENGDFFVSCGNPVRQGSVPTLESKLRKLQEMDRDQIRQYYREQLRVLPDEDSRGAGLGFIEMAKKSSRPIEFDVRPVDEDLSYFSITSYA